MHCGFGVVPTVVGCCQPQTKLSVANYHIQSFLGHKTTCKTLVKHLFLVSQSKSLPSCNYNNNNKKEKDK